MKNALYNFATARRLLGALLVAQLALTTPLPAASMALATAPLATSTTSTVQPNIMFILDDSGSMDWDYLPDWATTGSANLAKNANYNGVTYNPAINYKPPVLFDADGSLNTTTYPSQTGQTTATGADATTKPNWKYVKNDGYGIQSTSHSNLVGNASFYTFIAGEYCTKSDLKTCQVATAPTTTYSYPAYLRWCNSTALTNCRLIRSPTYQYMRYPGMSLAAPTTTLNILTTTGGCVRVNSLQVNGTEILTGTTNNSNCTSTSQLANRIQQRVGSNGFSASSTGSAITITAPAGTAFNSATVTSMTFSQNSATWSSGAFSGGTAVPGSNVLTDIVSTNNSYPYPGTTAAATTRTDCVASSTGGTCTYVEEMTNYANWWAYYHTRMQAMKTSVSRSFQEIDNHFRVGYSTIGYQGVTDGNDFRHIDTFELTHKNNWFKSLFKGDPTHWTPLRGALSKAGQFYAGKISGQTDPIQYSCQQNFTILSTDGYWNTNEESSSSSPKYGPYRVDGTTTVGNQDGGSTPRPKFEGPTAASNTLADIAMYYNTTDLRNDASFSNCTGGPRPDLSTGDVCGTPLEFPTQNMVTFTMGLGANGTLEYSSDYKTQTSGDFYDLKIGLNSVNWPNPITNLNEERIDDLWHAAVDGNGTYFSAKNPDEIITGLKEALTSISAKIGAAAAAATSTLNPVAGNNFAYVASYTTTKWQGNLEARTIDTGSGVVSDTATWCVENITGGSCTTGTVVADNSSSSTVYYCVTPGSNATICTAPAIFNSTTNECSVQLPVACTGTLPGMVAATSDTRTIKTANSSGTALIDFDAAYALANPTNFSAAHINTLSQWGLLTSTQQTAASANLLNFLRGQTGYEDRGSNTVTDRLYRYREAALGDPLESQPFFISKPVFSYADPGYTEFKTAQATRPGTVYMGANDGMMHAFAADTGVERWAYVPSVVIPNMWKLADKNYATSHTNFVNGSPTISDICTANCTVTASAVWKTILVGGLNAGGRSYYALDITDPVNPTLLWEISSATTGFSNLGYSYGQPIITKKSGGTWVVVLTSGYNNTSPGTGRGSLYVLNAATGAKISEYDTGVGSTTTPSGLAKIAAWNDFGGTDNTAGYIYGGDLLGNLWRFDINSGTTDLLATLRDSLGNAQPVTTTPTLGQIKNQRVVFVGTGKYLEVGDLTDTSQQTVYAIKDNYSTSGTLFNARTSLVAQTLTVSGTTRNGSNNAVDFTSGNGWYIDLVDSVTSTYEGERVNIDMQLVQGTLIFASIIPSSTVCSPGGSGWLNFVNYETGGYVGPLTLVSTHYSSPIVGINVLYILGKPIIEVVTATNPTPQIDPNVQIKASGSAFTGKRVIWRELLPD